MKKSDIDELFEWAKKQDFIGDWMPTAHDFYTTFFGEFFWAPCVAADDADDWTRGYDKLLPKDVLASAAYYSQGEKSYDCSIDETIGIDAPAQWLVDQMGLQWNGVEGHFFDARGNLIAFDPSVKATGPGALLINREALVEFLNENGYEILWTILGEKNIMPGGVSYENWKGRLQFNGAYRIYKNRIDGSIHTEFLSRD